MNPRVPLGFGTNRSMSNSVSPGSRTPKRCANWSRMMASETWVKVPPQERSADVRLAHDRLKKNNILLLRTGRRAVAQHARRGRRDGPTVVRLESAGTHGWYTQPENKSQKPNQNNGLVELQACRWFDSAPGHHFISPDDPKQADKSLYIKDLA